MSRLRSIPDNPRRNGRTRRLQLLGSIGRMAVVVVEVMPKPEILDPQGKAVTGALARLGFPGISVRQGKRFELELDGELTDERLAQVREAAEKLLANTVIETFEVRVEDHAIASYAPTGAAR